MELGARPAQAVTRDQLKAAGLGDLPADGDVRLGLDVAARTQHRHVDVVSNLCFHSRPKDMT